MWIGKTILYVSAYGPQPAIVLKHEKHPETGKIHVSLITWSHVGRVEVLDRVPPSDEPRRGFWIEAGTI